MSRQLKRLGMLGMALVFTFGLSTAAQAADAKPFIFDPGNLGGTSADWLENMGCGPDQGGPKNQGLVMFKLGATAENKSSGAEINGVKNTSLCGATATVGYDYQPAGWCGAGAPRFNIVTKDGVRHFVGCAAATKTPGPGGCTTATSDVHNAGQTFPIIPTGSTGDPACTIDSVDIVFDEGTDVGPGFAVIDNIVVGNKGPITKQ